MKGWIVLFITLILALYTVPKAVQSSYWEGYDDRDILETHLYLPQPTPDKIPLSGLKRKTHG